MIYEALERIGVASFGYVKDEIARLRTTLLESMPGQHADIMTDLTVLTATEVRVVADRIAGREPWLPVMPQAGVLRLAIAKTDTLPIWPCKTPERIANGGARLSDCFVYGGDLDKAQSFLETDSVGVFRARFVEFIGKYVELMTATPIGRMIALPPDVYFVTALIWRARLDVLTLEQNSERTEMILRGLVPGFGGLPGLVR